MTIQEKLSLPPGEALDRVILADLLPEWERFKRQQYSGWEPEFEYRRPDATLTNGDSLSTKGWWAFWEWLRGEMEYVDFIPQMPSGWLAFIHDEWEGKAETPLLAAWRAALAYHEQMEVAK